MLENPPRQGMDYSSFLRVVGNAQWTKKMEITEITSIIVILIPWFLKRLGELHFIEILLILRYLLRF